MSSAADRVLVAYVPVPHAGYLALFRKYPEAVVYVLGEEFIKEFQPLVRNLPAVTPEEVCRMIHALGFVKEVRILHPQDIASLPDSIVMPDEDVSHSVAERYLADRAVDFDASWKLRWHWDAVHQHHPPETGTVSREERDRALMQRAKNEAQRSPDWWRQIGALLAKEGEPLLVAYNTHLPSEQSAYVYGDPRSNFGPGERIDATLSLHAEAGLIAEAARRGISTAGCDVYVTTFPCPPCANILAKAGIQRLYFSEGYSLVAGAESLTQNGVDIIRVV